MAVTARFEMKDDGFDLMLGDRLILRQRPDAPAFRIAKGNPSVKMVRGNFALEDAPTDERVLRYIVKWVDPQNGYGEVFLSDVPSGTPLLKLLVNGHDRLLSVDRCPQGDVYDRLTVDFTTEPDEVVWGGGEQMSYFALNGRVFPIWTSEPGVGREPGSDFTDKMNADGSGAGGDYWTTNYPQPTFLSSRGYAIDVETSAYTVLDFSDPVRHRVSTWQQRYLGWFGRTYNRAYGATTTSSRMGYRRRDCRVEGRRKQLRPAGEDYCRWGRRIRFMV
jgi:sulfoquinovosidase